MSTQLDDDSDLVAFGLPVSTDAGDIRTELHTNVQDLMPGWSPQPGHPLTHLIGALAELLADTREAAQERTRVNLLDLLGMLHQIPRSDGTPASSTATVTARDTLGHTIAGPIAASIGDILLTIPAGITIAPGQTTTTIGLVCDEPGAEPNGATGDIEITAQDWLAETNAIVLDAPLAGGLPPEDDAAYANRMVEELQTMSSTLILSRDYSIAARRHQGVGFAWTIPHYNPTTNDAAAPFHVTTVAVSPIGGVIDPATRQAVEADIASRLMDNVVHHLLDPTFVPVPVTAQVARRLGFASADVKAATEARLAQVLAPLSYAVPQGGDDPNPVPSRVLHKNELVARLDDVESVNYPVSLQIGDGTSDRVALGVRDLPKPGTITVTVLDA